jgi:hypothetical protein
MPFYLKIQIILEWIKNKNNIYNNYALYIDNNIRTNKVVQVNAILIINSSTKLVLIN